MSKVQIRELTEEEAAKLPSKAYDAWKNQQPEKHSPDSATRKTVISLGDDATEDIITVVNPDGTKESIIRDRRPRGARKGAVNLVKIVEVDGQEFSMERRDPYGHWYILNTKDDLGCFTGHVEATNALVKYLRDAQQKKKTNGKS